MFATRGALPSVGVVEGVVVVHRHPGRCDGFTVSLVVANCATFTEFALSRGGTASSEILRHMFGHFIRRYYRCRSGCPLGTVIQLEFDDLIIHIFFLLN